jgi:hypothetical protein
MPVGCPGRGHRANSQSRSSPKPTNVITRLYANPDPRFSIGLRIGTNVGAGCSCHPTGPTIFARLVFLCTLSGQEGPVARFRLQIPRWKADRFWDRLATNLRGYETRREVPLLAKSDSTRLVLLTVSRPRTSRISSLCLAFVIEPWRFQRRSTCCRLGAGRNSDLNR